MYIIYESKLGIITEVNFFGVHIRVSSCLIAYKCELVRAQSNVSCLACTQMYAVARALKCKLLDAHSIVGCFAYTQLYAVACTLKGQLFGVHSNVRSCAHSNVSYGRLFKCLQTLLPTSIFIRSWFVEYVSSSFNQLSTFWKDSRLVTSYTKIAPCPPL